MKVTLLSWIDTARWDILLVMDERATCVVDVLFNWIPGLQLLQVIDTQEGCCKRS